MATVLYFGRDNRIQVLLQQFFDSRKVDAGEVHSIVFINEDKKLDETLNAVAFDVIFLESTMFAQQPIEFLDTFRKKRPGIKCPFILIGTEADPVKIMKFIEGGYTDYVVLPPDKPLLIEKFGLYASGKRSRDIRQVYSLQMSQQADLAKPGIIEQLSEFDCEIRSSQGAQVGELMILYSKGFGADMNASGSVLGRCYKSEPHQAFKGQFLSNYYFVGVTPDILTNIRNTLRKSYVNAKSK